MSNTLFTLSEMSPITDGIRTFIRSLGVEMTPKQLEQCASEQDLLEALSSIKMFFRSSSSLSEVQLDLEECLIRGMTPQEGALMRRRNLGMYLLVVEPLLKLFASYGYKELQANVDQIIDDVTFHIANFNDYGDTTDSLVATAQIKTMLDAYRALHQPAATQKKQSKTRNTEFSPDDIEGEYVVVNKDEHSHVELNFD